MQVQPTSTSPSPPHASQQPLKTVTPAVRINNAHLSNACNPFEMLDLMSRFKTKLLILTTKQTSPNRQGTHHEFVHQIGRQGCIIAQKWKTTDGVDVVQEDLTLRKSTKLKKIQRKTKNQLDQAVQLRQNFNRSPPSSPPLIQQPDRNEECLATGGFCKKLTMMEGHSLLKCYQ